ncbi:hypothetical protein D9613_008861 [Agrocybe pediades]|uniref:F-box domain-containing protein n=1 Tax=Agrocybe pediades TaxID=84607 RepID=A0A8H4QSZ7_9AGAR|nr:hypothetical protein D9613_008861 [Agrocybe pediades]
MESLHTVHSRTTRDAEKLSDGTRMTPNLPVELHGTIVNELKDEKDTLKQCALTCRLYRHLAQKLLFKSIECKFFPYRNPLEKFLDILKDSPQIANYVQRLSLCESGYLVDEVEETESQRDEAMSHVFPALINLVELSLRGLPDQMPFPNILEMRPSSRMAVMAKFESISSLTLHNVDLVPLEIFAVLHRLEKLELKEVHFCNSVGWIPQGPLPNRIKHIQLADLYLDPPRSIYDFFMEHKFAEGLLETLSIQVNLDSWRLEPSEKDFQPTRWFIKHSAQTLKVLDVSISEGVVPLTLLHAEPAFDVSEMPLLEHLSLGGIDTSPEIGLGWMPSHLETIPAGRKLKSITLHPMVIDVEEVGLAEGVLDLGLLEYFEKLITDVVLSQTESFSIVFTLIRPKRKEDTQSVKELIRKHLPTLDALNLLTFEDGVWGWE